jgi:hypothetical protein
MLASPVITFVTSTGVSGIACPGCTVEVFSDADREGRSYEGTTVADASGLFTLAKPTGFIGPYLTTTAPDRDGNTSALSIPQRAPRGNPLGPTRPINRPRSHDRGRQPE